MINKSIVCTLKNQYEIENIQIDVDSEAEFLRKFNIYDDSTLIKSHYFKLSTSSDFINEIEKSGIDTGIMISGMKINSILIYLCILDTNIFIIKQINLPKFQEYFNEHKDSLIFTAPECTENFIKSISSELKDQKSEQECQISKDQTDINISIKKEIINSIIKKSQYRTIKMRQELLPNKFNSKNDNYTLDDFIQIQTGFRLYYNSKDQILNYLKFYTDEKRFNHEIDFYHQIENTFPFIRKIFGLINRANELPIIILEYIEGKNLYNFILSEKEIEFNTKIKMIEEILFSVYYIHSNGFYLRDLNPHNIIIDSNKDAILIDFDSSKEMYSPYEEENTGSIGTSVFSAPEQHNSNNYTYKVDLYSVGMIIHFIITRKKYNFSYFDLSEIYRKEENISQNKKFPKISQEYKFIPNIYEKCFEINPNSRPCIVILIENIIFNNQINRANEIELPHIINQIEKYEPTFKIADKYMHEKQIERSYLQYFLGYIYYFGKYVLRNIDKSIIHFEKASNQNNSNAQFYLGEIYYKGKYISLDINKSIHYLTLSANHNNSKAQYLLGTIYYSGQYISRDINKSIHYLTLSANQNNSDAQFYLSVIYYSGEYISRDVNKSIHYLNFSANQNNPLSQYLLSYIYSSGEYISRDINKSIYYLTILSNQNDSNAQYNLGKIYYKGEYVSRDINKSIYYLTLSANQNNSFAQYLLGYIYYEGEYISRDINKSIYYLSLSSKQYNSDAQCLLGEIYYLGEYISRDINKSIYYLTISSTQKNSDAQYYLGEIYYLGEYISRDINKSIHYLTLSANQNNSFAQYLLGYIYYFGEYISCDINKSIHYLTLSANQNYSFAQYFLGYIYYSGEYISCDINKSIHYLTLSANQNNSNAHCLLGIIYYDGKYIEKDIKKSIHYFKESSSFYNSIAKNYLGIIYKNGDGVEKNIHFAKIYFKEAIKEKAESYSMYNLARIYYFGINKERKITKAISLLEKASNKQLFIADFFLFYIFTNCDDKTFLDKKKLHEYQNKCQNNLLFQMMFINFKYFDNIQKLHDFLRDYDLIHSYDYSHDLFYYLLKGKFYDWKNQNEDKSEVKNKTLKKDIDANFYKGFND